MSDAMRYNGDGRQAELSEAGGLFCDPETDEGRSKTVQSEKDQADINKIVARFERTGMIPLSAREGLFVDVSEMGDYREALEQVQRVGELFAGLPAASRARFDNDPAKFLDACNDPNARTMLEEIGVLEKPVAAVERNVAASVPVVPGS